MPLRCGGSPHLLFQAVRDGLGAVEVQVWHIAQAHLEGGRGGGKRVRESEEGGVRKEGRESLVPQGPEVSPRSVRLEPFQAGVAHIVEQYSTGVLYQYSVVLSCNVLHCT